MKFYVSKNAKPNGDGSKEKPFSSIQQAADIALPGDEVIVGPGIYREEVSPMNAGTAKAPVVFRSEERRAAIITGAEIINTWEKYKGDVWAVHIPNSFFGKHNPYKTIVSGDWLDMGIVCHTGEVFLNDKSLY